MSLFTCMPLNFRVLVAGTHKEIHSLDEKYALENDKFFVMSTFSDKEPRVLRTPNTFKTFLKSRFIKESG